MLLFDDSHKAALIITPIMFDKGHLYKEQPVRAYGFLALLGTKTYKGQVYTLFGGVHY